MKRPKKLNFRKVETWAWHDADLKRLMLSVVSLPGKSGPRARIFLDAYETADASTKVPVILVCREVKEFCSTISIPNLVFNAGHGNVNRIIVNREDSGVDIWIYLLEGIIRIVAKSAVVKRCAV